MRGGPGEKQIELDRRMIGEHIKRTKERLAKVKKQRQTQRRQRERRDAFNISLVGYTNAGKSTLFNALVRAKAYAADQLFATLDTTTRQLYLGEAGRSVSLSDTVGFIRDLPHGLIAAFAATLQEAVDADLLLHVVDAANPHFLEQMSQVQSVLSEIGAADIEQIVVFNKLDALEKDAIPLHLEGMFDLDGVMSPRVFVSSRTGQGLDVLRSQIAAKVASRVGADIGHNQAIGGAIDHAMVDAQGVHWADDTQTDRSTANL
jgi:GTP-binding protein HflX